MYVWRSLHRPGLSANPNYSFTVQACPSDPLALSNCLIVHPADFRDGEHVLVKDNFPLTVRYSHITEYFWEMTR